jgi:tetratricopeptide (TPR) repeat protein
MDPRGGRRRLVPVGPGCASKPTVLSGGPVRMAMASPAFVELASGLVTAMGQRLDSAKPIPEGLALQTGDGFLYAFFEDPNQVSLESVRRLFVEGDELPLHLVVLTPGHLPLAISAEVGRRGGTLVEGSRFHELVRQLGLEVFLGDEPRPTPPHARRLLPSAQQLDAIMARARTWLDWGVPALALRFYRQAALLKPEFLPARVGIGRSLLALGLVPDAERAFDELLAVHPEDVEARLGKAAALGALARPHDEIAVYRALLAEDQARLEVRAHLVAALIALADWRGARIELEALLERTPEDAQLRFLHAVALEHTGAAREGERERANARFLGLPYDREVSLCQHLGIPVAPPPVSASTLAPGPTRPKARPRPTQKGRPPARRAANPPSARSKRASPQSAGRTPRKGK